MRGRGREEEEGGEGGRRRKRVKGRNGVRVGIVDTVLVPVYLFLTVF